MNEDTKFLIGTSLFVGLLACCACLIWDAAATDPPWPARHAIWSGVLVAIGLAIIGRVYLFMRRIEDRP